MNSRRFNDLVIQFQTPENGCYPVTMRWDDMLESGTFVPPFPEEETASLFVPKPATEEQLKDKGGQLFEALFPEGVLRELWALATHALATEHACLRLIFELGPEAPPGYHWEILFDPRRRQFLALSAKMALVRRIAGTSKVLPWATDQFSDLVFVGYDPDMVFLHREYSKVAAALASSSINLTKLSPVSRRSLEAYLGGCEAQVFHFSGHGKAGPDEAACLGFQGEDQVSDDFLSAHELYGLIEGRGIRFAMLNGCDTAKPDQVTPTSSMAAQLVRLGLFSAVGMAHAIPASAAEDFATGFYKGLARGKRLEEAFVPGRRSVWASPHGKAFALVPVLFCRPNPLMPPLPSPHQKTSIGDVEGPETKMPHLALEKELAHAKPRVVGKPGYLLAWACTCLLIYIAFYVWTDRGSINDPLEFLFLLISLYGPAYLIRRWLTNFGGEKRSIQECSQSDKSACGKDNDNVLTR